MASTREIRRRIRSIRQHGADHQGHADGRRVEDAQGAANRHLGAPLRAPALPHAAQGCDTRHRFLHPLLETRPVKKRADHPHRVGQRSVRRAQQQPVPTRGTLRPRVDRLHHCRAQGRAVRSPHAAAARRRFPYGDTPQFPEARAMAAMARDLFLKGEVDEVRLIATRFVNTLTQQPVDLEFLPVGEIKGFRDARSARPRKRSAADATYFLFEPSAAALLELPAPALPEHVRLRRAGKREGQRAERAHGVDEERHRQRRGHDR